jgi:hypothetical protein
MRIEVVTQIAWAVLALIHLSPAAVALSPAVARRLYGIEAGGDLQILMQHRGWLFLAVFTACVYAVFTPDARRAAGLVTAISLLGFLLVYVRAGAPAGPMRKIALVDAIGLPPLAVALLAAWSH